MELLYRIETDLRSGPIWRHSQIGPILPQVTGLGQEQQIGPIWRHSQIGPILPQVTGLGQEPQKWIVRA